MEEENEHPETVREEDAEHNETRHDADEHDGEREGPQGENLKRKMNKRPRVYRV